MCYDNVFSSQIPPGSQPKFSTDMITCKVEAMFDFLVIIKHAGDVQNAFAVIHYTYFTELGSCYGLN